MNQTAAVIAEPIPEQVLTFPGSPFRLHQPFLPAGDQPEAIEKDSSINERIEQMRLSATKSLLERPDSVIVATVSCIYGIGDPVDYHSMILHLREHEKTPQREIIRRLAEMQYQRNELEFRRG